MYSGCTQISMMEDYNMNFIDKAFENKLHGDDFLQAMADIYSEPEVREILDQYSRFVKDVILIIEYDSEIQMGGMDEIICGNLEEQLPEILQALDNCGANEEADVLRQAKAMSTDDYAENYEELCDKLAINNDYDGFWDLVRDYIDASLNA